jgi:hypothetical protein
MSKEYSNENIKNSVPEEQKAYITWGDDVESKQKALNESSESLEEYVGVSKAGTRRYSLDYSGLDTNTSGRPGLTRSDYDYFRPEEAVPRNGIKPIIARAEDIYQKVGLVKNVIDLMGDFGVQGIRLVHKNKRIERFYNHWFSKVSGKDRSERFLNNLYKTGNVVVHRQTGKLSLKAAEKMYRSTASPDLQINVTEPNVEKREIPWIYTFIDPVYVDASGGALSSFVQQKRYELRIPTKLRKLINNPKTDAEKQVISNLPQAILDAAKEKKPFALDPDKVMVHHYKKDDWHPWAFPMIYSIMDDITVIEKLKLADMAALDGAISNIRIFKLGSLEHKIAPTKAATSKLAQILGNNVGGGTMDLVWGPDIELLESNTNVHQFLGEGKYVPHLNAVYAGLGIPPTLTGTFGAAGTTNNFISLKTLTQRLQYGRDVLTTFWSEEIKKVQKAMNFRDPARIEFDRMDLSNEEAEKSLLIQLADRNLISDELLQRKFGFDHDMEKSRLNSEQRARKSKRMVRKSSPYHNPEPEEGLKKIALQSGTVSPSEVGLELEPKKDNEKTLLEIKQDSLPNKTTKLANDPSSESLPGQPQEGRPKLSKDQKPRKEKRFSPQTGAKLSIWAATAQEQISDIINPMILEYFNKKNLRSLSSAQHNYLDDLKTNILLNIEPFEEITVDIVNSGLGSSEYVNKYNYYLKQIKSDFGRDLTANEIKQAKSSFYSMVYNK